MAYTKTQTQITWSAAATKSVASGATEASDVVTIPDGVVAGSLSIKCDNAGTPVSGDEALAYIRYTNGDPDAAPDSADEYDTVGHALPVAFDTFIEDPVIRTIQIDPAAKGFRLSVKNNGASSMTVSAQCTFQAASV